MSRRLWVVPACVLSVLFLAGTSSWARGAQSLQIPYDVVLDGKAIPTGQYTVTWESHTSTATVTFQRKDAVVASGDAQLVDRGKKYERNAVVCDEKPDGTRVLTEIRLKGSSQAIVFHSASPTS